MTDTRDLIQRLADMADALDGKKPLVFAQGQVMDGFTALANFQALANEAHAYLAQSEQLGLPPDYIDSEHTGHDREMLEEFYRACRSEGGSADEIHLRGLKAVIALDQPEPEGVEDRIFKLEADLERERLRLASCGVVAMADTPESAAKARDMSPEHHSASLADVIRQIDALMALRELIQRLLSLAEQAVNEALDFEFDDPEDRYIWRELQELKQLVNE
jgi:hypothetical protein